MAEKSVRGIVLRQRDGTIYFLPESALAGYSVDPDIATHVNEWLESDEVSGQQASSGSVDVVTAIEFGAAGDDEVAAFRSAFDPMQGERGYIRRCLNVIPADVLDLLEDDATSE